jgi:2-dehydropantoate 2-reductase
MRIIIIGTGALACRFGAELSENADVMLAGTWQEMIDRLNHQGIEIVDTGGNNSIRKIKATSDWQNLEPADLVLVLVKSYRTQRAALWAKHLLKPAGTVISLQNGLGNYETLLSLIDRQKLVMGVTSSGSCFSETGKIELSGRSQISLAQNTEQQDAMRSIADIFVKSGIDVEISDNIKSLIWGKLAVSAGINPLTAILEVRNGYLAENPDAGRIMIESSREVQKVAESIGIKLPYPDAGDRVLEVAKETASNRSSMLQDIIRGSHTEIDAISGSITEKGRDAGIDTPVNRLLWLMVAAKTAKMVKSEKISRC